MARTREFDEQALLAGAQELFWSRGFDDVSVEQITAATGVANGSIYAAYGTKLGIFLAVLERYADQRVRLVEDVLASATGREADVVRAYLEAIIGECASQPDRRGCLMINSVGQLGHRVPEVTTITARSTHRMTAAIARRIGADDRQDFRHLDKAGLSLLGAHIVVVSQGLIQLSRLGTSRARLRKLADVSCRSLPV